jgi:enoyl-CoA hydratase/carnithine racemase
LLDNDDSIKIIAIRSNHKIAFCAGGNIKEYEARLNGNNNRAGVYIALNLERCFRSLRKVLVAVVEGLALGGGC